MPVMPPRTKKQKQAAVKQVMHEFKGGELHSGSKSGPVVTDRDQAIAIAMSESGQSKRKPRKKKGSIPGLSAKKS